MLKKKKKTDRANKSSKEQVIEQSDELQSADSKYEQNLNNSFFYTNDKFINQLDNEVILKKISEKYSNIDQKCEDSKIKKDIILLIQDTEYVDSILEYFNISIYDLFKVLYCQFSGIFKSQYLKKLKSIIQYTQYAKPKRRKTEY